MTGGAAGAGRVPACVPALGLGTCRARPPRPFMARGRPWLCAQSLRDPPTHRLQMAVAGACSDQGHTAMHRPPRPRLAICNLPSIFCSPTFCDDHAARTLLTSTAKALDRPSFLSSVSVLCVHRHPPQTPSDRLTPTLVPILPLPNFFDFGDPLPLPSRRLSPFPGSLPLLRRLVRDPLPHLAITWPSFDSSYLHTLSASPP